jgi:DNA-binding PadR family transcriptional regulator
MMEAHCGHRRADYIAKTNKTMKRSYLNDFEQLVLLSVLRLGNDADGAAIRSDLETTANRSVVVATIYVALSRLEQRGYVRSWMSDPTPVRGGKARKLYAVEPRGREALSEARATLERMWRGVQPQPESGG